MNEKAMVPTHILALWAVGAAAVMQLGVMLVVTDRLTWRQSLGALIVSGLFGGCVTVVCRELLHWPIFLSGVAGTASGMLPAALSVMAVSRKALERAGITPADIREMTQTITAPPKEEP